MAAGIGEKVTVFLLRIQVTTTNGNYVMRKSSVLVSRLTPNELTKCIAL